jgi:hypothetical protein
MVLFAAMSVMFIKLNGQTTLPVEFTQNSIKEQINYLEERTRIYENYRAIREDMFRKINSNILDTLSAGKNRITGLITLTSALTTSNDSLNSLLETTRVKLEETTAAKNKISVLGIEIRKVAYNGIMWTLVAGLIVLLAIGFLVFKRVWSVNIKTGKELKELKDEFEAYRQSSRLAREKLTIDHFNEIKRLKGV